MYEPYLTEWEDLSSLRLGMREISTNYELVSLCELKWFSFVFLNTRTLGSLC